MREFGYKKYFCESCDFVYQRDKVIDLEKFGC